MAPVLQIGIGAVLLALSYVIILAASTAAFVIVDKRCEIFSLKDTAKEASDEQEQDDIR